MKELMIINIVLSCSIFVILFLIISWIKTRQQLSKSIISLLESLSTRIEEIENKTDEEYINETRKYMELFSGILRKMEWSIGSMTDLGINITGLYEVEKEGFIQLRDTIHDNISDYILDEFRADPQESKIYIDPDETDDRILYITVQLSGINFDHFNNYIIKNYNITDSKGLIDFNIQYWKNSIKSISKKIQLLKNIQSKIDDNKT
ncbi:MAG: hypothetical protein ACOC3V_04470 [bacterium]